MHCIQIVIWLSQLSVYFLRYHGRWIASVWKSRSCPDALKENLISLYIFWKLNSYRIRSYLPKKVNVEVMLKEIPRNTVSFTLVRFRAFIGAARLTSEMISHTSLSKRVSPIFHMRSVFFYNLLKFDIVNADVPFCKRGHNLETEAKSNKARHPFSNEVSLNVGADFQLIGSLRQPRRQRQRERR